MQQFEQVDLPSFDFEFNSHWLCTKDSIFERKMKKLFFLSLIAISTIAFGQNENLKHIQFINAEHPIEGSFGLKGTYIEVTFDRAPEGQRAFQIPIGAVEYEMAYEFSQGDGQNFWVLHIKCKDGKECISPTGWKEITLTIGEHRERAENILRALKEIN